jgi:hypothetical protein
MHDIHSPVVSVRYTELALSSMALVGMAGVRLAGWGPRSSARFLTSPRLNRLRPLIVEMIRTISEPRACAGG